MFELKPILEDARTLEPLPQSASRLAVLLTGDEWDMAEVCDTVRLDQALTGRLLGIANSARSGSRERVGTVEAAVMRLGTGAVLGLVLGSAVRKSYQTALPAYQLDEGDLWRHSVAAALAVEEARRFGARTIPPEAFASALLHDVGKLVLARHLTADVLSTLQKLQGEEHFGARVERAVLAIDHAAVGGLVARAWGLPEAIAAGIEHHERPLAARDDASRAVAFLVGLADAAAARCGAPCGGPEAAPNFSLLHAEGLGIPASGFDELCAAVAERLDDILHRYE